jgi:hypothetical protein
MIIIIIVIMSSVQETAECAAAACGYAAHSVRWVVAGVGPSVRPPEDGYKMPALAILLVSGDFPTRSCKLPQLGGIVAFQLDAEGFSVRRAHSPSGLVRDILGRQDANYKHVLQVKDHRQPPHYNFTPRNPGYRPGWIGLRTWLDRQYTIKDTDRRRTVRQGADVCAFMV